MVSRILWRRWAVPLACLVLAAGTGSSQPPQPSVAPAQPSPGQVIPVPNVPALDRSSGPVAPAAQTPPAPQSIDQLMEKLEQLRRQKAVLEKEEQAVTAELRVALQKQKERLAKLGIEEEAPAPPVTIVRPEPTPDLIPPSTVPTTPPKKK
jgi:hypothetical protein